MKVFLLEDELSQQIRVEKHIAEIAKELDIKLEVISTGKISEFENYIQHSDIHQLYFLDIHIQDNEYCGLEIAKKIRDINPSVILIFLTSFPKSLLDLLERESSASLSAYLSSSSADKASLNTIFSFPSKACISARIFINASLTLSEEADLL